MPRLIQVAQHAEDLDRASAFYAVLFGTDPIARFDPPGLVFFDLRGVRLLLELRAPRALHYFDVTELHREIERLRALGVVVVSEPHVIFQHSTAQLGPVGSTEWQAFVRDSEGNLVGLVEQRLQRESA